MWHMPKFEIQPAICEISGQKLDKSLAVKPNSWGVLTCSSSEQPLLGSYCAQDETQSSPCTFAATSGVVLSALRASLCLSLESHCSLKLLSPEDSTIESKNLGIFVNDFTHRRDTLLSK